MAELYAVDYNKRFVEKPAKLTDPAGQGGRMRVLHDEYAASGMSNGDTIVFGKIPAKAKIWQARLSYPGSLGAGTTLKMDAVGDATVALLAASASTGAGSRTLTDAAANANNVPHEVATESDIVVTLAGANQGTDQTIKSTIWYSID